MRTFAARSEKESAGIKAAAALSDAPGERDRRVLLGVEAVLADADHARLRSLRPVVEGCADTPLRRFVLSAVMLAEGRVREAEALVAEALAGPEGRGQAWSRRAAAGHATVQMLLGRWEQACTTARWALQGEIGWGRGAALQALAVSLIQLGRLDGVKELLAELATQPGGHGDLDVLGTVGLLKLWSDDLEGAAADLQVVASRARGGERAAAFIPGLGALGEAHYRRGDWDQAVVHGELAVTLARDIDPPSA